ncbi:MAG TPA: ferritin family protein [Polyangia bacterium]|jgi:rubrerythrin
MSPTTGRPPSSSGLRRRPSTIAPAVSRAQEPFTVAEGVELLAARLYLTLARRFAAHEQEAAIFRRLAAEEQEHARRVALMASSYAQDPGRYGEVQLDLEHMARLTREGETLLGLLEDPNVPLALTRAMELAAELEDKFSGAHAEQMAAQSNPTLREFFETFMAQDRAHAALLKPR